MARTRASLLCDIWLNDNWRSLTSRAKYLYVLLLSQPKLTLAGCLDVKVARWSEMAPDTPPTVIDACLSELVGGDFIALDEDTDELVIRTFVKHDVGNNKNSQRGVWSAWQGIESEYLRRVVVANIPDVLWDNPDAPAPETAAQMRYEALPERSSGRPIERLSEPPVPAPVPPPTPPAAAVLDQAAVLLGLAEADRRGAAEVPFPAKYAQARAAQIRKQHDPIWLGHLAAHPGATADDLVDLILRPKLRAVLDHTEPTAAAYAARYAITERRKSGEACPDCEDRGVILGDDDVARPCGTCRVSA